jgi:hypothetical protein
MTFPHPYEHRFTLDGEPYRLVGWTRGGDRRINADYALALSTVPGLVLDAVDGGNLYAEAVSRECLTEAPDLFWESKPPAPGTNGTVTRVATFDQVPIQLWERFRTEVNAFVAQFRPVPGAVPGVAPDPGTAEPDAVAALDAVPPRLSGRAE